MKNWLNIILLFSVAVLATSCEEKHFFEEHHRSFSTLHWKKGQKVNFNPTISDTKDTYTLIFAFRHVYGFQLNNFKIRVHQTTPSGDTNSKDYKIQVFGGDDKYLSTCAGDICDLETAIEEELEFSEDGEYTYEIEHLVPIEELPNVMEVGMIINKKHPEKN